MNSNTLKKNKKALIVLLFLITVALSILPSSLSSKNNVQNINTVSDIKTHLFEDIEAVEIYKFNPYKETSLLNHWYFREEEDIKLILSILYKGSSKASSPPTEKLQYKIFLNFQDGTREIYPLWLNETSKKSMFFQEDYKLIDEEHSSKLKKLMELN